MARNKEKHVVGLNRLWLQTLDEENLKKNPPRPGLGSLKTASEVRKWIPSIKKDIDFCLKQSQVTCYPDSHIEDYTTRIDRLTREYKAYIRKLRELEPQSDCVPWTDRPYKRKNKTKDDVETDGLDDEDKDREIQHKVSRTDFAPIRAPILEADDSYRDLYGYNDTSPAVQYREQLEIHNSPLVFTNRNQLSIESTSSTENIKINVSDENIVVKDIDEQRKTTEKESIIRTETEHKRNRQKCTQGNEKSDCSVLTHNTSVCEAGNRAIGNMKLYVPYSDSSSDDDGQQL